MWSIMSSIRRSSVVFDSSMVCYLSLDRYKCAYVYRRLPHNWILIHKPLRAICFLLCFDQQKKKTQSQNNKQVEVIKRN